MRWRLAFAASRFTVPHMAVSHDWLQKTPIYSILSHNMTYYGINCTCFCSFYTALHSHRKNM